ncbi:MAG: CvpA family protein, partial [Burkholderiaceae bacterium]|nr:CvpA family protein [Burkholderiaceae bacterium]
MQSLNAMQLTTLDYFAIGILVVSAAVGLWRGFFREIIALVAWFAAAWLAYHFCNYLATEWLSAFIPNEAARLASAFLLIFVAVLIALIAVLFELVYEFSELVAVSIAFNLLEALLVKL